MKRTLPRLKDTDHIQSVVCCLYTTEDWGGENGEGTMTHMSSYRSPLGWMKTAQPKHLHPRAPLLYGQTPQS